MLLQFDITGMEWILGIGIMFGLAFVLTVMSKKSSVAFAVWLLFFNIFVVLGGLLPIWTLYLCLILMVITVFLDFRGGSG